MRPRRLKSGHGDADRHKPEKHDQERQLAEDYKAERQDGETERGRARSDAAATGGCRLQSGDRRPSLTAHQECSAARDAAHGPETAGPPPIPVPRVLRENLPPRRVAPAAPRSLVPVQTAIPIMLGPGRNWQRLTMSANSGSGSHCRLSTTMRCARANPPLKRQLYTCQRRPI